MNGRYDVAQICLNGHLINAHVRADPQHNSKFCNGCGASTTAQCSGCKAEIRGQYIPAGLAIIPPYRVPAYCHDCGSAYPWTDSAMQAARDLIELDDKNSDADKAALAADLPDLVRDTPRTQVAATRFRKFLAKATSETASALRDIAVDIASEAAKKTIFGP